MSAASSIRPPPDDRTPSYRAAAANATGLNRTAIGGLAQRWLRSPPQLLGHRRRDDRRSARPSPATCVIEGDDDAPAFCADGDRGRLIRRAQSLDACLHSVV